MALASTAFSSAQLNLTVSCGPPALQQQDSTTRAAAVGSKLASRNFFSLHSAVHSFSPQGKQRGNVAYRKGRILMTKLSSDSSQQSPGREFCLEKFEARQGLKVIAGLHNFNVESVTKVVIAAEKGGATHVDIACDADLVRLAASLTSLPICVSAIEPEAFVPAVKAGAHMVEVGNYDGFYTTGRVFSAEEVIDITRRTRKLLPNVVLSVTVPHTLPLDEQVRLAELLVEEGADLIQTEGGTSSTPSKSGVLGLIEKASPTLAAAYSISRAVKVPVICASGLSVVTTPMAITAGAAGVGIGAAVNRLSNQIEMIAAVRSIADSLGLPARSSSVSQMVVN